MIHKKIIGGISSEARMVIFAVTLVLVPFIIFSIFSINKVSQFLTTILKNELQTQSNLASFTINDFIGERIIDAKIISQANILKNKNYTAIIKYLTRIIAENKYIKNIDFINAAGAIIVSSGIQNNRGKLLWDRYPIEQSLFLSAKNEKIRKVYVSEAISLNADPSIILLTPVNTNDHNLNFIGLLSVEVSLKYLTKIAPIFDQNGNKNKLTYIIDNNDRVIISNDPNVNFLDYFPDLQIKPELLNAFSLQGEVGNISYANHNGEEVMVGYADMNEFGENKALDWSIAAIWPMEMVVVPVADLRQILFIIGGIIALLFGFLAYRSVTFFHKNLSDLATRADEISQGNFTAPGFPESNKKSSFNTLMIALNRMQISIRQSIEELEEQKYILDRHSIVSITDRAGIITYANNKFQDISGYSNEELIGKTHQIINSGYHPIEFFANIWKSISRGYIWQGEICNKSKNGELYWVLSTLAPLFDSNHKIDRYISIRMDITEHKQAEIILRRTQKLEGVGEITSGIAHDFNNLLGIIIGNHDLMKRRIGNDSKLQEQLSDAQNAALRGAQITRKLLNFSRQSEELNSPVNINEVICDYQDFIRKSLTAIISLEIHAADDIWLVDLNPDDLQDALINLSLNARDAMPSGGKLTFEVRNTILDQSMLNSHVGIKEGEFVEIVVSDSGTGISKKIINKIYNPFFTTKDKNKGTGLGLAMVFAFIKRCKGSITVYSEKGLGTTFRMYFPRSQSMSHQLIKPTEMDEQPPRGNETILIVDDEKELAAIAKDILEDLGYTTICAFSGDEAHEIFKNNDAIDIVFTDIIMPGTMNGFDLAEAVATAKPAVKILLTSGFTGEIKQEKYPPELLITILNKPYLALDLATKIREILEKEI